MSLLTWSTDILNSAYSRLNHYFSLYPVLSFIGNGILYSYQKIRNLSSSLASHYIPLSPHLIGYKALLEKQQFIHSVLDA